MQISGRHQNSVLLQIRIPNLDLPLTFLTADLLTFDNILNDSNHKSSYTIAIYQIVCSQHEFQLENDKTVSCNT